MISRIQFRSMNGFMVQCEMANTGRIKWFDALKMTAIFMLLWRHCIVYLLAESYSNHVYFFLYPFHMPLFMTISGYFSAHIIEKNLLHVVLRKFRQLMLPALFCGVLLCIVLICFTGNCKEGDIMLNSFWFLKSVFVCSLLYLFSYKKKRLRFVLLPASILLSQAIQLYNIWWMYPSFLLGVVIKRFCWLKRNTFLMFLLCFCIYVLMLLFLEPEYNSFVTDFTMMNSGLYFPKLCMFFLLRLYRFVIGGAGTLAFISLSEFLSHRLPQTKFGNKWCLWGQWTLGIYIFQVFILETLLPCYVDCVNMNQTLFTYAVSPAISLVVLLLCLGIIGLIHYSRWASFLLLGEKPPYPIMKIDVDEDYSSKFN